MAEFIGDTVKILLHELPGIPFQGVVAQIIDQRISLRDIFFPDFDVHLPTLDILAPYIADLEIIAQRTQEPAATIVSSTMLNGVSQQQSSPFHEAVDRPKNGNCVKVDVNAANPPSGPTVRSMMHPAIALPEENVFRRTDSLDTSSQERSSSTLVAKSKPACASVDGQSPQYRIVNRNQTGLASNLPTEAEDQESSDSSSSIESIDFTETIAMTSKGYPPPSPSELPALLPSNESAPKIDLEGSSRQTATKTAWYGQASSSPRLPPKGNRGAGHTEQGYKPKYNVREELDATVGPGKNLGRVMEGTPKALTNAISGYRNHRQEQTPTTRRQHIWALERATDIHGKGEYDFQGNLSKFDKRSIFAQLRSKDPTAEGARLVAVNRPSNKVGIVGGNRCRVSHLTLKKKKHDDANRWNSEAGETEAENTTKRSGQNLSSSRSSRMIGSRHSLKRIPSRRPSAGVDLDLAYPRLSTAAKELVPVVLPSPFSCFGIDIRRPEDTARFGPGATDFDLSLLMQSHFRIIPQNRICPVVSPTQMTQIERVAEHEEHISRDMMTENAARGIAQAAFLRVHARRRRRPCPRPPGPLVMVVLAGKHENGVRAIAAARHLCNHDVSVTLCLFGFTGREMDLPEGMSQQLHIFRRSKGKVVDASEYVESPKAFDGRTEVVIDALMGLHSSMDNLRMEDHDTISAISTRVRDSKVEVVAIDMPTGLSASNGLPCCLTWERRLDFIRTSAVVSMGAPKTGLLKALATHDHLGWELQVADLGIINAVWRKYGPAKYPVIEHGFDWLVHLLYIPQSACHV